jgi:hypothetical protein
LLFALAGCVPERAQQWKRIAGFLEEHGGSAQGVRTVLVLTDEGCPSCNKALAGFIVDHLDRAGTRVVVSAAGRHFDISPLLERREAIIWDDAEAFGELGILNGSGAVLLTEEQVDTVIPIRAADIEQSLAFIQERAR